MSATVTSTVPDTPSVLAVTVILVPVAAEPALKVAVASPLASVVAWVMANWPALAVNFTVAPVTRLLPASFAVTLITALVLPSAAISVALEVTVTAATVGPVVPPLDDPDPDPVMV
jgi:hypothetical protein